MIVKARLIREKALESVAEILFEVLIVRLVNRLYHKPRRLFGKHIDSVQFSFRISSEGLYYHGNSVTTVGQIKINKISADVFGQVDYLPRHYLAVFLSSARIYADYFIVPVAEIIIDKCRSAGYRTERVHRI